MMHDVIVVGSGPAGTQAASALIERGRRVLMLDVGDVDDRYEALIPPKSFSEIRSEDASQHRYFLGDNFEGVSAPGVRVGAQLTPPRAYVTASAARFVPVSSATFTAAESLALGGLGSAWGAGVFPFDDHELSDWPISRSDLEPHYEAVARRIGISGERDDLSRFWNLPPSTQSALDVDSNAASILARYAPRRSALNARGFYMGRVSLAVCTTSLNGRGPHQYRDMEFWGDTDRSVYRPRWTVEALRTNGAFTYVGRQLVLRFDESPANSADNAGDVTVTTRDLDTNATRTFRARALVLAAGTLGTSRIVLRSLNSAERVPLLCNPYTYAPVVNWRQLGQPERDKRHSLAQLSAIYQPDPARGARGSVQVQLYSYRSLLTFRLLGEAPLPYREGLGAFRLLLPGLGILGINHEDERTEEKYCRLRRTGADDDGVLEITYALTQAEQDRIDRREREVLRCFRSIGVWPIRRVRPGHGSSIHYAGTFPMTRDARGLTSAPDGRLGPTRAVYLVDGAPFPYLPAKGLTFTIMANANRVATQLADRLA